jgi:hypothetical protein
MKLEIEGDLIRDLGTQLLLAIQVPHVMYGLVAIACVAMICCTVVMCR